MATICASAIHLCRIRVTRLNSDGSAHNGPNNTYVSDKPLTLTVTPQIEAGVDRTMVGGCDCIVAEYRGYDKLKYFTLELDIVQLEPAMFEMMTGADVVLSSGNIVGNWWASQVNCSAAIQPNVAFEGWQDTWEDDHQKASPYRYVHWIWPSSFWQIASFTLQNDFNQPRLTGFTRGNTQWGLGIYADTPSAVGVLGGYFFTDTIPTALCGYQTESVTF